MGGGSVDEPMPGAIQDAVAAAIEGGATMDEIVARVRSLGPAALGGDRSPLIPRARRCARARPAEGRWAGRMQGLICLQREANCCAEEWVRMRDPRAEGLSALIAIEILRTLALRHDGRPQRSVRSLCRRRTSPASPSRSTVSKAADKLRIE